MSADLLLLAVVDGLAYASLLFIISLGLTLIFGVFGVINVAHGSLYAFGGYAGASVVSWLTPHSSAPWVLLVALVATAALVGGMLGALLESGLLRPFQHRDPTLQLLITFSAFMILEDVQRLIWGSAPYSANEAALRLGTFDLRGVSFMNYQLFFVPAVALAIYVLMQILLRHSVAGKKLVAVIHHREVATALGINAKRTGLLAFTLAGALGALGGALSVPTTSFVPGLGADMIVASFAVVATGGLGQITGALLAAVLIGLTRSIALYTQPELEVVMPYLIMVLVLLVRPNGLFTIAVARRI